MSFFDIVIARSENHVIGVNNSIPWKCKKDLEFFKKITTQGTHPNVLIMGRKTWESLPRKPLPNRIHIILSKTLTQEQINIEYPNIHTIYIASSLDEGLQLSKKFRFSKVYVIGGAEIYQQAISHPRCLKIYESIIHTQIQSHDASIKYLNQINEDSFSLVKEYPEEKEDTISFHVRIWKRKQTLLWWIDPSCYEKDWLDFLFHSIPTLSIIDTNKEKLIPNAIIIANQLVHLQDAFRMYHLTDTPYTLIHLSDEYLDDDYSCYRSPCCKHIFRNYYHPYLESQSDISSKLTTFAIGYRNMFHTIEPYIQTHRPYLWSFAGYLKKSDRTQICQLFHRFQPYHLFESMGFNTGIMDAPTYSMILRQSKFVLCPIGNCSLDTFRLYEALEAGAIPVTLYSNVNQPFIRYISNYWEHIFGKNTYLPFIVNPTWEQNVKTLQYLLENTVIYERIQSEIVQFWKTYKNKIQQKFTEQLWNTRHISI